MTADTYFDGIRIKTTGLGIVICKTPSENFKYNFEKPEYQSFKIQEVGVMSENDFNALKTNIENFKNESNKK